MSAQPILESAEQTIERLRAERDAAEAEAQRVRLGLASGDRTLEVHAIYEYWRSRCRPRVRKLGEKRGAAVRARLADGYSVQEVMRAVDGARFGAYVTPEGQRMDDLELICRDDVTFQRFYARWEGPMTRGRLSVALNAYCLPAGVEAATFDHLEGGWRWRCPSCMPLGWEYDDYLPLLIGHGFIYCEGGCVGITLETVRAALVERFPLVPGG